MSLPTLLVDGWNVLLRLLHRERMDPDRTEMGPAGSRLILLLDQWAALRGHEVVVAWDRARLRESAAGRGAVRSVFLDQPAEADDWLVEEARRLAEEGREVAVATADRGLIKRLPRSVALFPLGDLSADLEALAAGPVVAPHVGGANDPLVPAGGAVVDTRRLPRRHAAVGGLPIPRATSQPTSRAPEGCAAKPPRQDPSGDARAAAAQRKEQRRKRHARRERRRTS